MKKKMAIICPCLLAGCLLLGIMIAEVFREYPYIMPTIPGGVTGEEKEEAIRIALNNESVKEKIEGLEYEVRDVIAFEKWMTGEKLETVYVDIHIKGTGICYTAKVNLTEGRVTRISESYCGDKIGEEKSRKASKIAQNDPRIKERIEGKIKERDYEVIRRNRLIGKKLVVDVCIEIKEPPERYVATVDTEEWKVIGVWKAVPGTFFEKGEEIKISVPCKVYDIQLVKIQPWERLAATSELNLAHRLVTRHSEEDKVYPIE